MPRHEAKFSVNAPPDELWSFIRDVESLCTCVPGVERVTRVDDRKAELTVKEKIGVVPLIVDLTARIDAEDPPRSLHAVARAENLTMEIDVALRGTGNGTELIALFDVAGEGPLKPIIDRLFERRATERAAGFADCLANRFGAVSPADAGTHARDRIGRIRRRLGRYWRRLSGPSTPPGN